LIERAEEGAGAALRVEALRFAFEGPPVIDGVDLSVAPGELVGILGPNGAGKTTLLRLMTGALVPDSGRVELFGRDLPGIPRRERARRVAVVPQEARVVFDFTVQEIVLMGRAPHLGLLGIEREEDLAAAHEAMQFTDTEQFAEKRLAELSGGEKQRVLIARALAQQAALLLLDEPTAFLDIRHRLAIYRLTERLRAERGLTVVAVSHDINLAARFCPRLVLLHGGRVAADGRAEEVITRESMQRVYEADVRVLPDPETRRPMILP